MRSCPKCDCAMESKVLPEYVDDLMGSGVPIVLVNSAIESTCENCGLQKISVPDFNGLVAAVALTRSMHPLKFRGAELRFLRKALGLSAKDLATRIGVSAETVSRWENDKEPIKPPIEKLVRLMVGAFLSEEAPLIDFEDKEVTAMRILSVCNNEHRLVMRFERMKVRIYPRPAETHWERLETAA